MRGQLRPHRLVVGDRVAFHRRQVDEVDEHRAALDVGEELVTEPGPLGRPFDQPGDVGDHRLAVLALDRPQHRRERRERVVGDLRRRPRQPAQQRGLAGVRQPDQPDVGQQFQPQLDPVGFAAACPSRRSAAPAGSRSRSACCRARRARRGRPPPAAPARRGRSQLPSTAAACVPGGTGISRSSPRAPCRFDPSPCRPRCARKCLLPFSAPRSRRDGSQTSTTSPPCPPSPPSGPPRGTCASRRKLRCSRCRQPRPQPRSSPCRTSAKSKG